jgi:hypothetical protein
MKQFLRAVLCRFASGCYGEAKWQLAIGNWQRRKHKLSDWIADQNYSWEKTDDHLILSSCYAIKQVGNGGTQFLGDDQESGEG